MGEVSIAETTYYEGDDTPAITFSGADVSGKLDFTEEILEAGEIAYTWQFTPTDTVNYEIVSGTISINAVPLVVEEILLEGNYKSTYEAYSEFTTRNLIVKIRYNSGKEKVLTEDEYTLSKEIGTKLEVGDIVTITHNSSNVTKSLGITVEQKEISVVFSGYSGLLEKEEEQEISIFLDGEIESTPCEYTVTYKNLTTGEEQDSITDCGQYEVVVTLLDENYSLTGEDTIIFNVNKSYLEDENIRISHPTGFDYNSHLDETMYTSVEELESALGRTFKTQDRFILAYSMEISSDTSNKLQATKQNTIASNNNSREVNVSLNLNTIDQDNLLVCVLREGQLLTLEYTVEETIAEFTCLDTDYIILLENTPARWISVLIWVSVILAIGSLLTALVVVSEKKRRI